MELGLFMFTRGVKSRSSGEPLPWTILLPCPQIMGQAQSHQPGTLRSVGPNCKLPLYTSCAWSKVRSKFIACYSHPSCGADGCRGTSLTRCYHWAGVDVLQNGALTGRKTTHWIKMDNCRLFSLAQALYVRSSPCVVSSTAGLVQRAHSGKDGCVCGSSETAASMFCDHSWGRILVRFLPEDAVEASGTITVLWSLSAAEI